MSSLPSDRWRRRNTASSRASVTRHAAEVEATRRLMANPESDTDTAEDTGYSSDDSDDSEYYNEKHADPERAIASKSNRTRPQSASNQTSRNSSASHASEAYQPPRGAVRGYRRVGGVYFYRISHKISRYLCFGMMLCIAVFILSLVRASQVENWKIQNGKINKPPPPPPTWEQFNFLTRYYGGLKTLATSADNVPEYPIVAESNTNKIAANPNEAPSPHKRSEVDSKAFVQHPDSVFARKEYAEIQECFLDANNKVKIPPVRYYQGRPMGFPKNIVGSYEALDLPEDICFERFGRYGPYGFGYSQGKGGLGTGLYGENNGSALVWGQVPQVDFRNINWADVQRRCYQKNIARFDPFVSTSKPAHGFFIQDGKTKPAVETVPAPQETVSAKVHTQSELHELGDVDLAATSNNGVTKRDAGKKLSRTALVLRAWDEYEFKEEDFMNIRAIISELSLASGGRYDVHLLVQVKNDAAHPIWADEEAYQERIRTAIPEEFRDMVTLWSETQMLSVYQGIQDVFARGPDLPVHGPYRGISMAMQHFASQHPEYEHFWQWELDARYTGHYYDLFTKLEEWAKAQPRKGLWERNERFYVPEIHGTWEEFKQLAKIQAEMGVASPETMWNDVKGPNGKKMPTSNSPPGGHPLVWGPVRPKDENDWFETENDPVPPTASPDNDKYEWGVGEEADLISLYPIFDPEGTSWLLADDYTGYNTGSGGGAVPRRAHMVVTSRVSRKLLMMMHRETAYKKHFAFPEMWQATVALQHGLKAVAAPQPLFVDRAWPPRFLNNVLNAGRNGASGGARASVFGQREHNLQGLTWMYNSGFAPNLYRRWLGLRVNNDGGEEFEMIEDESKTNGPLVSDMRGGEGRMCLPPMLLHPVKAVDLPAEQLISDADMSSIPESDPSA